MTIERSRTSNAGPHDHSGISSDLAAVEADLERLELRWPASAPLRLERRSDYYQLPFLLHGLVPGVARSDVRSLALFCRLYAGSILLQDQIIDGAASTSIATGSLRVMAMQAAAYHSLQGLFASTSPFWARFQGYIADYVAACLEEQSFASGARPWSEYTEAVAMRIIVGKNGLARSIPDALIELAGEPSRLDALVGMIDSFNLATQLWDDLQDWKEDLSRGAPSLLIARVVSEKPLHLENEALDRTLARVGRELYYGGHTAYVLDMVIAALDAAERFKTTAPNLGLYAITSALRRRADALRRDIRQIVSANVLRAQEQPRRALRLPAPKGPWQALAQKTLRFIERQWTFGFGEARDLMQYPEALGLGTREACYFGDVFQRALIADAIADVDAGLSGALRPILDGEAAYLIERRLPTTTGGWPYFWNLPELPPDADVLAQIMQALLRAGRRDAVAAHAEAPLAVLLSDNAHPDGSFETWIVPAAGRTALEERHAALIETVWSPGPDCDVIPNLLYALYLYDPSRFADIIQRGVAYIEGQQRSDGAWESRWYAGPYYALHVCLRLFSVASPASPAVAAALSFLREAQRGDGGFGLPDQASDPMNTALALLALAEGQPEGGAPGDLDRAAGALALLERAAEAGFPAQRLIFKGVGAYHGSRTLTATFMLKAALAWHARAAMLEEASR